MLWPHSGKVCLQNKGDGETIQSKGQNDKTAYTVQDFFRSHLTIKGPFWEKCVSELAPGDDGTEPIHHVLGECFACCVPGDKGQGGSDPHWLLLWCYTWSLGELIRAQAMPLSRILASLWQSGQIHALGITQSRAELVEKRCYSKLLLALGAVDRSSARHNTGHWAALTSTLFRSTWAEGKVPWKVKDSPFFDVVFLQTPGVLPGWFCCKPA